MTLPRLNNQAQLPATVLAPRYDRSAHGAGILHIGLGAFHRAHQAVATDDALAAAGGDWAIIGANLRSRDTAEAMAAQDGLYTVLIRGEHTLARVIGAHAATIGGDCAAILEAALRPEIRILSLTISEKAYGIDRDALDIDDSHPAVAADLAAPDHPQGALGLITMALAKRRRAGHAPFTVLCCDNLAHNGALLRAGVLGFARRVDPDLAAWIAQNVAFPSTMVDRITPATTAKTLEDAARLTGHQDLAAIETEPFTQWIIEDNFPQGRPYWEAGGVQFVPDVAPYEAMKLRLLNGSHSLIAYMGQLAGLDYVRDVVADPKLRAAVVRHMAWAAGSLDRQLDTGGYIDALLARFANPAIDHETRQIAMDATQKLPQRWFAPALELRDDHGPLAFAVAVWLAYLRQLAAKGARANDPQADRLFELSCQHASDPAAFYDAIRALPGFMPAALAADDALKEMTLRHLDRITAQGLAVAVEACA